MRKKTEVKHGRCPDCKAWFAVDREILGHGTLGFACDYRGPPLAPFKTFAVMRVIRRQ